MLGGTARKQRSREPSRRISQRCVKPLKYSILTSFTSDSTFWCFVARSTPVRATWQKRIFWLAQISSVTSSVTYRDFAEVPEGAESTTKAGKRRSGDRNLYCSRATARRFSCAVFPP